MKRKNYVCLKNKDRKERELCAHYYACFSRLEELFKKNDEELEKDYKEDFQEIVYLLEEVRFLYRLALILPYKSLGTMASFVSEIGDRINNEALKDFKEYPFFKDDSENAHYEIARKNFERLNTK